jgi:MarR family transcriptional regulator, 2-MHQ and catechol-resistance regulon repressor
MPAKPFLPLMRELVRCYQAFEHYSALDIRTYDLTPAQFDVIATLGNTQGMTFRELGEKTLITKGTLTGVVDRLEDKGLVKRGEHPGDGRCFKVMLTPAGEAEFQRVFYRHLDYLATAFDTMNAAEQALLKQGLESLRVALSSARESTLAQRASVTG